MKNMMKERRSGCVETEFERAKAAIEAMRIGAADTEEEIHMQAARMFENAGLAAEHEVRLAPRCRIDFMIGTTGIEIKKKRPQRGTLIAQLARYAACPQVERLIVLAPRGVDLPNQMEAKPVTMMSLEKLWGISLP